MLSIGNVYGHGFSAAVVADVEAAGFTFRPGVAHYEGTQLCRFLDFESGPSLEMIEVEDGKAYLEFVPLGMKPYSPGISLEIPDRQDRQFPYFERHFPELRPYRLHANYNGSRVAGRAGWEYLNFAHPVIRDVFIWLTKPEAPQPRRATAPEHPNGARGVRGLVLDTDAAGLERLARLAEIRVIDGALDIDGVMVWSRESIPRPPPVKAKVFPLLAVVIETADLDALPRTFTETRETNFGSWPAVHLETNDLAWDLLLTGPRPPDARRHA